MLTGHADLVWPCTASCMHLTGVLLTCRIAQLLDLPGLRREASNLVPKLIAVLQPNFAAGNCVHTILKHICTVNAICMHCEVALQSYCGAGPAVTLYSSQLHCHAVAWNTKKGTRGFFHPRYCVRFPVTISFTNASFTHTNRSLHLNRRSAAPIPSDFRSETLHCRKW